jgi:hypothetical protein
MRKSIFFILLAAFSFTFYSCHKEGIGGKARLRVFVRYGLKPLVQLPVSIKYGAKSSPGYNLRDYDDHKVTGIKGSAQFEYLYKGDYFIYSGCPTGPNCDDSTFSRKGMHVKLGSTSDETVYLDLDKP